MAGYYADGVRGGSVMRRQYAGGAKPTTLSSPLGGSPADLIISGTDFSNYPTGDVGPFFIVIDRGFVAEEKILCLSRSGNTITVFNTGLDNGRGADGTTVLAHSIGATVEHIYSATDADEANLHVNTPPSHITVATSATRPASPVANQTILQTDTSTLLSFIGGVWVEISGTGASGAGVDKVFWENDLTITTSYTLTTGKNAGTFGPVTIDSGVTVTVPSGSVWSIV
jgi:hypothetical protein